MAWKGMSSDSVTAGRLWSPELSFNMMERDWALFQVPFDFELAEIQQAPDGNANFNLTFFFPESIVTLDETLDNNATFTLDLFFQGKILGGQTDYSVKIAFNTSPGSSGSTSDVAYNDTTSWFRSTRTYTTIPSGETVESMKITTSASAGDPGSEDGRVRRTWGDGSDCSAYFTFSTGGTDA